METAAKTTRIHAPTGVLLVGLLMSLPLLADGCSPPTDTKASKFQRIQSLYEGYRQSDFPDVPEITVEQLPAGRGAEDPVLIDVRETREQDVSMIPGAIRVQDFKPRAEQYRGRKLVAYCTIGARSGAFVKTLRERGFEAYNLRGSILAWAHADRTVLDGNGRPTARVHVYGAKWNLLPDGYEGVW